MDSVREFLTGVLTLPDPSLIPFAIGLLLVPVAIYGIVRWANARRRRAARAPEGRRASRVTVARLRP
jgi:hypothetical protein